MPSEYHESTVVLGTQDHLFQLSYHAWFVETLVLGIYVGYDLAALCGCRTLNFCLFVLFM